MTPKNSGDDSKKIKRLGESLIERGLISQEDLDEALEEQKTTGELLGQILIRKQFVREAQICQVLAKLLGVDFLDLSEIEIPSDLISLIPEHIARNYTILPIKKEAGVLKIAMVDPKNTFAIDEVRAATGLRIKPVLCPQTQILEAIERYYKGGDKIVDAIKVITEEMEESDTPIDATHIESIRQLAEEAPIVKLVNALITDSVKNRASDIHIEPTREDCRVRSRIDGILQEVTSFSQQLYRPVISRIKIMSNLDIAERRVPQDGSFQVELEDKSVDIRVSTFPTIYGEKCVMRLLVRAAMFKSLDELGFEPVELVAFESLINRSCGIILVVGPTGSGKTTTLYSALDRINSKEKNIITIEDPVEYTIHGISQSQINVKAGFNFANSLRSMMRQDPDIILVGEIRDLETAHLAIRAALTGHLVFSTLHTNDSFGAVTRLIDMGIEPFLISSSLIGVLAQRLARTICSNCKERIDPPALSIFERFHYTKKEEVNFSKGKGCNSCRKTGYKSREGIFELLQITGDEMRQVIASNFRSDDLKKLAQAEGFRTLKENGFRKAAKGITTLEEVLRVTELV